MEGFTKQEVISAKRAREAEAMPEVYPKGWVGPGSGSLDLTNDSLKDFKISRKLKLENIEV